MQHTLETLLDVLGPGEDGTLYGRTLQELLFMRPLLLGTRDIAAFPKTETYTEA